MHHSDSAKEKPQIGEVIAVGPGVYNERRQTRPLGCESGDFIFGKWSGTEVKLDGEDFIIMKESDVLGITTDPALIKKAA
jgi:chaperonin GroES